MDRGRTAAALFALAACIACTTAAPTSDQTALEPLEAPKDGCYYNFQHYGEGDRIMTNEPCLNCTCHNRMLMCYLRVCPFTKPIGQDCTIEKRADQCCPIVTCPDVPVDLLTSTSTNSPAEYGETGLGKLDKYGCSINGKYFPEGSKVPPSPNKPCEHCYCIRNMTTCVMQECTLHVDGCTPIYHKDVCCPVRYSCDHPEDEIPLLDDMTTTMRPTPGFLLTTTMTSITQPTQDCIHDDQIFPDGALIKTEKACEHCYCMKGDIVCVVQECGTPMENEGKNCTSLPPRQGQCCPGTYICEGDEPEANTDVTTPITLELTTGPPRRIGVEGSGYRNEPDEPQTEVHTFIPDFEGSGEDHITSTILDITETSHPDKDLSDIATTTEFIEKVSEIIEPNQEENVTPAKQDKYEENTTELNNEVHDTNEESVSHYLEITTKTPEYIHTTTHTFSTVPKENEIITESVNNVEDINITQDKKTTVNELSEKVTTEQVYTVTKADGLFDTDKKITTLTDEYQAHTEHSVTSQEITTQSSTGISASFSGYEPQEEHTVSNAEQEQITTVTNDLSINEINVSTPAFEPTSDKDHVLLAKEVTTQSSADVPESSSINMLQEEQTIGNMEQEYIVTKSDDLLATANKISTPAHEYTAGTEYSISDQEITTPLSSGTSISPSVYEPQEEQPTTVNVGIIESHTTTIKEEFIETTSVNPIENEVEEDNALQTSSSGRIPGEGDCLLNSVTYKNNSLVPSTNNCHTSCKCISSIIKCDPIICSPPPEYMNDCEPIYDSSDACCPTYICNTKETLPPQSHNQMSYVDMNRTVAAIECNSNDCVAAVEKEKEQIPSIKDCSGNDCPNPDKLCNEEHGCSDISTNKCDGENCSISPDIITPNEIAPVECNSNECVPSEVKEPTINIKHCSGSECATSNQDCDKEHGCQDTSVPICEGEKCQVIPVPQKDNETNLQGDIITHNCTDEKQCDISVHLDSHIGSNECNDEACKNKNNEIAYPQQVPTFEQSTETSLPLEHSTTLAYEPYKEIEINLQSTEMPKSPTEVTLGEFITGQTIETTETSEHLTTPLESVTNTVKVEEEHDIHPPIIESTKMPLDKESPSQESQATEIYDHSDKIVVPLITEKDQLYSSSPEITTQIISIEKTSEQPIKPDDTIANEPTQEIIRKDHVTTQSDETATIKQTLGTLMVDLEDRIITTSEKIFTEQNILYTNIPEKPSTSNIDISDNVTNKYEEESSTTYIETPTTVISQKATSENINTYVDDSQSATEENIKTSEEVSYISTTQSNDNRFVTEQKDINISEEVTHAPRKESNDGLLTTDQIIKLPDEITLAPIQQPSTSDTSATFVHEIDKLTTESLSYETKLPDTSEANIPVNINEVTYLPTETDLQNEQGSATTLSSNTNQHEKESDLNKEATEPNTIQPTYEKTEEYIQAVTLAPEPEETDSNELIKDEQKTTVTEKEEIYSESPEIINVEPTKDTFLEDKEQTSETTTTRSKVEEVYTTTSVAPVSILQQTTKYSDIEPEVPTNTPEKYVTTLDDNSVASEKTSETKISESDNLSTDVNKIEYITPSSIYPTLSDNSEHAIKEIGNEYSLTSTNTPLIESTTTASKISDSFDQDNKSEFTTATILGTTELQKETELNSITDSKIDSTISPIHESVTNTDRLNDRFAGEEPTSVTEKIYTVSPQIPQIITEQQVKEEKPYLGDQETNITTEQAESSTSQDTEKDRLGNEPGIINKQPSFIDHTSEIATLLPMDVTDVTKHDTYNLEDHKKYTTESAQITTQKTEDQNVESDKDITKPVQGLEEIEKLTTPSQNIEKLTSQTEKAMLLTSSPTNPEITTKASLSESSSTATEFSGLDGKTTVPYNRLDAHDIENEQSTSNPVSQFNEVSGETQNLNTEPTVITSSEETQQKTTANLQSTTTEKVQSPDVSMKDEDEEKQKDITTTSEELYPTTSDFVNKDNQIDENILSSKLPNENPMLEEELKTPQPEEQSNLVTVSISENMSSEAPVKLFTTDSQNMGIYSDITTAKQSISELQSVTRIPSETTSFSLIKEDESRTTVTQQYFTPSQQYTTEISELKVDQSSSEGSQDITISEVTTEKLIPTPIQEITYINTAEKETETPVYSSTQKEEEVVVTTQLTNIVTDKTFEETSSKPLDRTDNIDKINIMPQETETKLPIDITDHLTTVEPKPIEEDVKPTILEENTQGSTEKSDTTLEVKPIYGYETEKQEPNTQTTPTPISTSMSKETVTTNLPSSQVTKITENEVLTDKQTETEIITSDTTEKYDVGTEIPINYTPMESEGAMTSNVLTTHSERSSEQPEVSLTESNQVIPQSPSRPVITTEGYETSTLSQVTHTKSSEFESSEGVNLVTEIPSFNKNEDIQGRPSTETSPVISNAETEPLPTMNVIDISPSKTVTREPEDIGETTIAPPPSEEGVTDNYGSNIPYIPVTENKIGLTTIRNDLPGTLEIINQSTETEIKYSETTPYYIELEEHTHQIKEEATSKITPAEETATMNFEPQQTERGDQDIENLDKYSEENLEVEHLTEKITTQGEEHIQETTSHVASEEGLVEKVTENTEKPKTHSTESLVESTSPYALKEDEKEEVTSTVPSLSIQEGTNESVIGLSPSSIIPTEITTLATPTEKATILITETITSTEKQIERETAMPEILVETSSSDEELIIATSKPTTVKATEEIATQPADVSKPEEKPDDSYISPEATKPDYSQQPSEKPDDSYISPETTKPDYNQLTSEKPDDTYISPEINKPDDGQQPSEEIPPDFPPSAGGYGQETDYVEEDQAFGPGTCRYGGKVYVSAQQIPRDDPCDFCFCFRSDIICLQQSCPPPIHGCHEEPIQGFCCPRYECPVSMATAVNVTTTTTTTTTTLPPHFLPHAYKGAAQRRGCQIKGHTYKVGEVVRASSGPCLHCTCGGDGQMKCDPKVCTPEPMLRQMIAAAVSTDRRR